MFYRIEALRYPSGACEHARLGSVVEFTRSRRRGDVFRATYRFLLAGRWVRVVNDNDDKLISGPFDPKHKLPVPDAIIV
ncbi:MAG: hypothetical protein FWG52_00605 [Proteobacteria bacterium]|jgi:hypothetical protein|nr:hypothetical protein [Pseudomonadota bacterium]